jgi:hypothetical protein
VLDFNPLQRQYSVMLQDGLADVGETSVSAYISQVGDVPSTMRSILFSSDRMVSFDRFVVSLNGTPIPMQLYSVGDTVNPSFGPIETFIGDISAFAGATGVELRFTNLAQDPSNPFSHGAVDIDLVRFSPKTIPEPSTLALLTVAALAASAGIFRRRRGRALTVAISSYEPEDYHDAFEQSVFAVGSGDHSRDRSGIVRAQPGVGRPLPKPRL